MWFFYYFFWSKTIIYKGQRLILQPSEGASAFCGGGFSHLAKLTCRGCSFSFRILYGEAVNGEYENWLKITQL